MKKRFPKIISALLAVVMILGAMPLSAFAAAASDLPENMTDHSILRALEYTGYDVQQQISDGTLYQSGSYGSRTPSSVLSGINYGTSPSGKETVADSSTPTGKAPDMARFRNYGLCCASFVTYYVCNYLPNVEGIDTSLISDAVDATGWNSQAVVTWQKALNGLVDEGKIEKIGTSASNVDRSKLTPGDLVIFGDSENSHKHIAVYSGTYNGIDFIIHVGNDRGPEISRIDWMGQAGDKSSYPNAYYHLPEEYFEPDGEIEVYKKDTNGKALAGAVFVATNTATGESVKIGPTNSSGYAKCEAALPYGTYTVKETVFPTNYHAYGQTEWTVTIGAENDGLVTINAVNEIDNGSAKIVKTSEDGVVEGVTFTIQGNGVNQTVTTGANGAIQIDDLKPGSYTVTELMEDKYEPQEVRTVTVVSNEVATVTFNNVLKRGDLTVQKTSEDGLVEGVSFHLYGTSLSGHTVDEYATTDANGVATFKDVLISGHESYTLEEVDTAERYIVPEAQRTAIEWNVVTEKSFYNELKRGDLTVKKTSEDGFDEGMTFHLYGTSFSGIEVDEYATTNSDGVAYFNDILIGTGYTIEEVNTAVRYVVPAKQFADIAWDELTEIQFENILKKWRADVYKLDAELTGRDDDDDEDSGLVPMSLTPMSLMPMALSETPEETVESLGYPYGYTQGDATLGGAVYGVFKGEELIDTYTTDENGYFLTDYYVCDDDWTIREISPSEGYLLDDTVYYMDAEPGNFSIELNTLYPDVYEDIIHGDIAIIKHTDDGSTQIETPEVGATFEIFLKSAGSYENAADTERDVIVCDEHGFGQTKMLPYGTYTVHQVSGWEGRELMPDFDVYVSQDETTYRYLINNRNFESFIHVVKVDAETDKTIPYAGAAFKIFNPDGELVTMSFTYPTPTTIDTFYTDENGTLVTPEKLPYGKGYFLVEVEAPYGYVLDTTPVYFDVTEENSESKDGITVIKVNKGNVPQKGVVNITKTGEAFVDVTVNKGVYQPIYGEAALKGAVFEICAAEDIITLDGTVRYVKGEVVDTITTGADGTAESKELYLGKYEVQEITAAYGYVLNGEVHQVELIYAGQEVSVTETATAFYNERQTATLSMIKVLETNELFDIGDNGEIKNVVFGLYAAEDITAADGAVIPVDGLIEVITFDESGLATVQTDLPLGSYYVKEIATDEHYVLNSDKYEFSFDYAGQEIVSVVLSVNGGEAIENELIYGSVSGLKVTEKDETLAEAVIGLFKKDETVFTEETALMITTSAEDGFFSFENIPYGEWIVREIAQPVGFVLDETAYDVVIKEDGQVIEIEIVNEYIMGDIILTKVDAEYPDNKLSGATFEIYKDVNADGVIDEGDELLGNLAEKENGVYEMLDLYYGHYLVRETVAPEGFLQDEGVYSVFIDTDEKVYVIENEAGVGFINKPIKGNITLTKVDAEYPDNKLTGATFEVYQDVNADGLLDENDVLLGALTEGDGGVYSMMNLRYGHYLIKETVAPAGFLLDEGVYAVFVETNGTTYIVENEAGVGFINNAQVGKIRIEKTSEDGVVEGFTFKVEGTDITGKAFSQEFVTNEDGEILIEGLRIGDYVISEVATDKTDKYVLPDDVTVTVHADKTVVAKFHNELKPVIPDNPKTGDSSNLALWATLAVLSLAGVGITGFVTFKKRKKEDE